MYALLRYPNGLFCSSKDSELKSNTSECIFIYEDPLKTKEYKNHSHYLHHIFTDNMDITYFYCIGYSIQTIPDFHGNTRRFLPVHSVEMSEIRENVNQEFVEKYEEFLKKFNKKRMWELLISLHANGGRKRPRKSIPLELGHMVYQFLGDLDFEYLK